MQARVRVLVLMQTGGLANVHIQMLCACMYNNMMHYDACHATRTLLYESRIART